MVLKLSLCVYPVLVLLAWESTSKSVIKTEYTNLNLSNISGVAESILNGGGELITVVEGLHEKTKEMYAEQIKKTEFYLIQLQQGIDKLDEKHKTFAAEAMALVLDVKTTLRFTRTDLNGIARRIISGMEELKVLAQAIFSEEVTDEDEINMILNWNVVAAKNMITEGKEKVDQAQKDYEDVGMKLTTMEEKLIQYKQFIDDIVKSERASLVVSGGNLALFQQPLILIYP